MSPLKLTPEHRRRIALAATRHRDALVDFSRAHHAALTRPALERAGVLDDGLDMAKKRGRADVGGGPAFVATSDTAVAGTVGVDRHSSYGRFRQAQRIAGISADLVTGAAPVGADLHIAVVRIRAGIHAEITGPLNRLVVPDGADEGYVDGADLADADGQGGDKHYFVYTQVGSTTPGGAFQVDLHTSPSLRTAGID
jgi:hypothetical protein